MDKQEVERGDFYCSRDKRSQQLALIGSAGYRPYQLVIELAPPWGKTYGVSPDFPPKLLEVFQKAIRQGKVLSVSGMAPDQEYSVPGWRRVIFLALESEKGFHYRQQIYRVTSDQ